MVARRRSKIHVYPDDWKTLPIALVSAEEQAEVVALVDKILTLFEEHGYPLKGSAAEKLLDFEVQIDRKVADLHQIADVTQTTA